VVTWRHSKLHLYVPEEAQIAGVGNMHQCMRLHLPLPSLATVFPRVFHGLTDEKVVLHETTSKDGEKTVKRR
jgi:hypothetical protein